MHVFHGSGYTQIEQDAVKHSYMKDGLLEGDWDGIIAMLSPGANGDDHWGKHKPHS